jgi:hypothetical protein
MSSDLVKRLRSTAKAGSLLPPYPEVINAAADRIEELEALVSYLAGTNKDHVKVMLAGNPIVCDEIMSNARAALEGKND